ncbi:MAG TPA: hypothetical protein ENI26_08055 [Methylophaga aminisulfidivorans]|uniref:Uncharacterized protein n=2 Tax=root TaxID=1 RepID=A0A7C1ZW18_9GAMM|nr:hypothetical protein [Methylophaga sp.]HEC74310.1 hypothetical protein [Methylophaga aminisulfidivorans]
MSIEQNIQRSFSTPEINEWLINTSRKTFDEAKEVLGDTYSKEGYGLDGVGRKVIENLQLPRVDENGNSTPPKDPVLYATKVRHYGLFDRNTSHLMTQGICIIPVTFTCTCDIYARLWIKNDLSGEEKTQISEQFYNFDLDSGIDPNDIGPSLGVPSSHYKVELYITLYRQQHINEHLIAWQSLEQAYLESDYKIISMRDEWQAGLPEVDDDSVVVSDPENPGDVLERELEDIARDNDCLLINKDQRKVADLFTYPEFKMVSKRERVRSGCFTITITVYQLCVRDCNRALWAFTGFNPINTTMEKVALSCFEDAVIKATFVGLATANFQAAVAAFQLLILDCIEGKISDTVPCMINSLKILKTASEWRTLG